MHFCIFYETEALTFLYVWDYNPLTDEGGGAASDGVSRSGKNHTRLADADWDRVTVWSLGFLTFSGFCLGDVGYLTIEYEKKEKRGRRSRRLEVLGFSAG